MPEKCMESCAGLERLEQRLDDLQKRNGEDHKEFRLQIQEIEKEEARQSERFDRIMDNLAELKSDNKSVLDKLTPLTNKMDDVDKLSSDVEELKSKPGKKWEKLSFEIIGAIALAVLAFVLGRVGL